jgi:hypothetical protein
MEDKVIKPPTIQIIMLAVVDLKPAKYNPRRISRDMLNTLKNNIRKFGVVDPIVVNKDMTLIGGHQRLKACIELGMADVPCVVLDLNVEDERVLNLALNKIGGDWDYQKLIELFREFKIDTMTSGFTDTEIDKLLKKEEKKKLVPEYDISPRLMEEYNYIVLFFKNTLDFQVASQHFGLKIEKEDTREQIGLGKVADGAAYLARYRK